MIVFRSAQRTDIAAVVRLLAEDAVDTDGPGNDVADYLTAFDRMRADGSNHLIVGEVDGRIVATYQIAFISGVSLKAPLRAQLESVRVAAHMRRLGLGAQLIADAEARAKAAGCSLMQLTSRNDRVDAARFYRRLGFTPSHIGYKRDLS